jgi:type IV secretory pathway component VirB8
MNAESHKARPLTADERQSHYGDVLSFYGDRERTKRRLNNCGWVVGAVGIVCMTASAIGWTVMLPLKTVDVEYREIDHETGTIRGGVHADQAAALFGPKEAQHFLQQYIDVREGYDPNTDKRHWDVVQEMSSPEVFTEYAAWRKSDLSPVKQLGTQGHVNISAADFSPHGKDGETYEYTVRYRRQEVREDAVGPVKPYSTVVAFQWHPKAKQSVQEEIDNPGGFVVVAYSAPRLD